MSLRHRKLALAMVAASALLGAGCASQPNRPDEQIVRAETGIEFAEESGAREYGAVALEDAREHLDAARRAADAGEYDFALRAAQKAELDAELAAAQTDHLKAAEALEEIHASIESLRREIQRARAG